MADFLSLLGCPVSDAALEEPRTEEVQYHTKINNTATSKGGGEASPTNHQHQSHDKERNKSPVSEDKRQSPLDKKKADVSHLPILIIPGFMSSGLEIIKSDQRPNWEGKRVWLNLSSLGLSAMYFGSARREKEDNNIRKEKENKEDEEEQEQQHYKSFWLNHMCLNDSTLCTDPKGIQVRAIQGLEGVDYLTPGAFTNHVSYVFGPVIDALRAKGGYVEGVNLQAAPYDWRLPPMALEQRDQYFSRTLKQVEELYRNSHKTPVVVVGHSLGTKTAHYFLNFCLHHKGQDWIDKHIHTYLPVGAPHLGAPKALRSVVAGDKMGLDAFLSDEEALAFGRGIGSGPWLFPQQLPPGAPSSVYVKPHGVLELWISEPLDTHALVNKRTAMSKPNRYQLIVTYGKDGGKYISRKLHTPFMPTINAPIGDSVLFTDQISFATEPEAKDAINYGRLRFFLQEPGIAVAKEEKDESFCCCNPILCLLKWITCCCICDYTYRLVRWILCGLWKGVALSADAITGGVGGGTNLAFSAGYVDIPPEVWNGKTVTRQIRLYHKDDYQKYERFLCFYVWKKPRVANLSVQMKWIPYDSKERSLPPLCSPVCQPHPETDSSTRKSKRPNLHITHSSKKHQTYQEFAGHDILEREGLTRTLQLVAAVYDADSDLGPRTKSALEAPPVQRIHAIYGINIATEVGSVYKRKDNSLSQHHLTNLYQLDTKAQVDARSGYSIKQGILYETPKTRQAGGLTVCGDGTVPYWSLQHCKTWESEDRRVSVVELDRAEHREILADARFHEALLEYCKIKKESV